MSGLNDGSLITFWAGVWYSTHDLLYLVDGGCPGEQGFSQQHLSQDAAKAPHVHTFSVPVDEMGSFLQSGTLITHFPKNENQLLKKKKNKQQM